MSDRPKVAIDPDAFDQKRYEIAKDVLASTLSDGGVQTIMDQKQRESIIFNCVELADLLMLELGYFQQRRSDEMSVHNLATLLKKSED